jgi:hypothetical protein
VNTSTRTARLVSIALAAGLAMLLAPSPLAKHFSEWSQPVNLGPTVNTTFFEVCPTMTRSGLSLYFGSNRPGGFGAVDIYVSRRETINDPWGLPQNLGPAVNTAVTDNCPFVTPDGHTLIFLRNPGVAGIDVYASSRRDKRDDLGWETAVPLAVLNSPFDEVVSTGYEDEETGDLVLYLTSNRREGPTQGTQAGNDIYMSRTAGDGTPLPPTLVAELSTSANDLFTSVRKDGRELFLSSDRSGTVGSLDFWVARRRSTSEPWNVPENLGPIVNTTRFEQRPVLSRDALTMIFTSNRLDGNFGNFDLYETTRIRDAADEDEQ